jgi:para-aminobenzoate synthetase component I
VSALPRPLEPWEGWLDPAAVFALLASDDADVFWLDSGPDARAGWSWVGRGRREPAASEVRAVSLGGRDHGAVRGPVPGAWVGWVGYETGAARAGAPVPDTDDVSGEVWLRVEEVVGFDHANRRVWAGGLRGGRPEALRAAQPRRPAAAEPAVATARHTPAAYAALIDACREHIRSGDAYQLCLTTRFEVAGALDPVDAYLRLRAATPAHHGGFLRSGDTALLSASPERFLEVDEGVVRTHPIKGTRPRDADPEVDDALADELRADAKENAENVMIVDLMRNDLAQVCTPGSVTVERLLHVESYPAVHQLVSTVSGRLAPGVTLDALLVAAFPAGSMTGAPKLSAMTILHELEGAPRGVYAGCFGWVDAGGAADLAMVIRSILITPEAAAVGAGGGITWLSRTEAEVAEVAIKARGPLAALGAATPPGWGP